MITGLPDGYRVEYTNRGYSLYSDREVIRNDGKGPLSVGKRHVATFRGATVKVIREVAFLDSKDEHQALSRLLRGYGSGVIRWGHVDTHGAGLPKQNKGRHHDAVRVPNLERKRKDAGFDSTAALSRASGVHTSHLHRIEAGLAKAGKDVLEKLARPLRMSTEELVG